MLMPHRAARGRAAAAGRRRSRPASTARATAGSWLTRGDDRRADRPLDVERTQAAPGSATSTTPSWAHDERLGDASQREVARHVVTSRMRTSRCTSAGGGGPVPASMNDGRSPGQPRRGARASAATSRSTPAGAARDEAGRCGRLRPRGRRARQADGIGRRASRRCPGRSGSGSPSTAGSSPSRSTSSDSVGQARASAAATTVVPLPPLADQQMVTGTGDLPGGPTRGRVSQGDVGAATVPKGCAGQQRRAVLTVGTTRNPPERQDRSATRALRTIGEITRSARRSDSTGTAPTDDGAAVRILARQPSRARRDDSAVADAATRRSHPSSGDETSGGCGGGNGGFDSGARPEDA